DVTLEPRIGDGDRVCRCENMSQQEIGKGMPACTVSSRCRVPLECKRPARELVAYLVVVLSVVLEPEREGVFAVNPGQLFDQLECVVVVGVRTFGVVADPVEPGSVKANERDAPSDRQPALLARYADLGNHVGVEG